MSRTKSDFPTKSKLIQSRVTPNEFKYFKECAEKEIDWQLPESVEEK